MTGHKEDCGCKTCADAKASKAPAKYTCTSCGYQALKDACGVCADKCPTCGGPMHPETHH